MFNNHSILHSNIKLQNVFNVGVADVVIFLKVVIWCFNRRQLYFNKQLHFISIHFEIHNSVGQGGINQEAKYVGIQISQ